MTNESENWMVEIKNIVRSSYMVKNCWVKMSAENALVVKVTVGLLGATLITHETEFKVLIKAIRRLVPRSYTVDYKLVFSI